MKVREIDPQVYELSQGMVKVFALINHEVVTLIDTGLSGQEEKILQAIEQIGYSADQVKHILITHFHSDHIGGLPVLKELTGATVYAHRKEVESLREEQNLVGAPGLRNRIIFNLFIKNAKGEDSAEVPVDVELTGGEVLDFAGKLEVVNTPGHSPGHTSYLYPGHGGILFVGDAATGGRKPSYPVLFTNEREAMKTLAMIGAMDFKKACFSHGRTIEFGAPERFRESFHRQIL